METLITDNACRLTIIDNHHYVTMPDGTIIPKQIMTKVVESVNERPYALIKVFIDLKPLDVRTLNVYVCSACNYDHEQLPVSKSVEGDFVVCPSTSVRVYIKDNTYQRKDR